MLKHTKGLLPSIFNEMFIQNTTIHRYNTIQANNIHVSILKEDCHNKLLDLQERSYGISCSLN